MQFDAHENKNKKKTTNICAHATFSFREQNVLANHQTAEKKRRTQIVVELE